MEALQKLGIDGWSLLLYFVNTGILIAILSRLLYRPLLRFLDERRETIKKNLHETDVLRKKFESEMEKQQSETKHLLQRMQSEVATAKTQAEARAKELMAEADRRREEMLEQARREVEETKAGLLKEVEKETQRRIEETILHVLKNKIPADVVREGVRASWKELNAS